MDRQRHFAKPGLRARVDCGGFRHVCGRILRWRLRAAGDQRNQCAGYDPSSSDSRSSTAVRPLPLGAIRASRMSRLKLRKMRHAHRFHVHEHVLAAQFVGPLDEAIAANAVEPFDLHRLERSRRIRKRLAVRAFAGGHGRSRLLRQGRRDVDRQHLLGLKPALQPDGTHSIVAPSGTLRRPCSRSTLKCSNTSPSRSSLIRKPKPRVASNHFTRPVMALHLGRTRALVRLHRRANAPFGKFQCRTHHGAPIS